MDAELYIKEKHRMCSSMKLHRCFSPTGKPCPLKDKTTFGCNDWVNDNPAEAVAIVERWREENPIKTRADKFKEVFGIAPENAEQPYKVRSSGSWWDEPYEEPKEE